MLRWRRVIAAVLLSGSLLWLATDQANASQVGTQITTDEILGASGLEIAAL